MELSAIWTIYTGALRLSLDGTGIFPGRLLENPLVQRRFGYRSAWPLVLLVELLA